MSRPRLTARVIDALADAALVCRSTAESMEGEEETARKENLYRAAEYIERLRRWHRLDRAAATTPPTPGEE